MLWVLWVPILPRITNLQRCLDIDTDIDMNMVPSFASVEPIAFRTIAAQMKVRANCYI